MRDVSDDGHQRRPSSVRRRALAGAVAIAVGAGAGVAARELGALDFALGERFDAAYVEARSDQAEATGVGRGDKDGYDRGFGEGEEQGRRLGYDEGFAEGRKEGEARGYEGAGTSIREVSWSEVIGGSESGICVDFTGTYFLDNWRWEFEFPDGEVDVIDDSAFDRSNDGWCYSIDTLARYTDTDRLYEATLTIYVTRSGLTDRWGPRPAPLG